MFIQRVCLLYCVLLFVLTPSFFAKQAEKKQAPSKTESKKSFLSADTEALLKDIQKVRKDLLLKQYNSAILLLTEMLDQLKHTREQDISAFFPAKFDGFEQASHTPNSYFSAPTLDYGVLFSRTYKDKEGKTMDVNVVFEDPSVKEYIKTIQDPKRLKNLGNAQVISVKDTYKALEKHSEEEGYLERNIVIHNTLLVNVVAVGLSDASVMDTFIDNIQLSQLASYLK